MRTTIRKVICGGADAYITKPFNAKNLELLVQNIQKSRKQSIEHFKQAEELNIKQITNNPRDEIFMKELMELIMANLTKEDFGVTEITAHLRISRSLLHMKLKSLTGCSITQFIRTIKMKEAKTHLLNGMNVSEASLPSVYQIRTTLQSVSRKNLISLRQSFSSS